jgi:hypothetical protein
MCKLKKDDYALLELVAIKPVSYLPPIHHVMADRLCRLGLIRRDDNHWHPTAQGLALTRRTLH